MSTIVWEKLKKRYCDKVATYVFLEAELIYPADLLSFEHPRVLAHRCSHANLCNANEKAYCIWCGTNPNFDPFHQ